eukprot:scaffold105442_cov23-Cyclotella_meneghiniana.AAC.1
MSRQVLQICRNQHIRLITHLETMVIDATLIGSDVSPLTADGGMNKTQPSIRIGTSNTSVESFSQ